MTPLVLIRHGPTSWNAEGRIQGRSDIPLSPQGTATVERWALPGRFNGFTWYASPLVRALETARLLKVEPRIEARLAEMNWGEWEGKSVSDLRAHLGAEMMANEDRGLDFQPPGGESPRDVQQRLMPWLRQIGAAKEPAGAVTHKGVIRAVLALAADWDMMGKAPSRLEDGTAHLFALDEAGRPTIEEMNIPLENS